MFRKYFAGSMTVALLLVAGSMVLSVQASQLAQVPQPPQVDQRLSLERWPQAPAQSGASDKSGPSTPAAVQGFMQSSKLAFQSYRDGNWEIYIANGDGTDQRGYPASPTATHVHTLEAATLPITFPRLLGYRYEMPPERLSSTFTAASVLALSTADIPTRTENTPIVASVILTLDDLKRRRPNEVAYRLAELLLRKYFRDDQGNDRPWLFPQVLAITKRWLAEYVVLKDNTFVQLLMLIGLANDATDRIYSAIVQAAQGAPVLKQELRAYDQVGSTRYVDFDTTRKTYLTHYEKCHVSHCTLDSNWEATLAERIENMPEVVRYVKNQGLDLTIPYTLNGETHQYVPDYIVCLDDGHGSEDPLNLIVEVTGEKKKDKAAKVLTATMQWVPAVNNHGGFGRWAFVEITDPWDAVNTIRGVIGGP